MTNKIDFISLFNKMPHVVVVLGCSRLLPSSKNLNSKKNKQRTGIIERSHAYPRVMKALEVYNSLLEEDKLIICSGYNKQAEKMSAFLHEHGVPKSRIRLENQSTNTIENCILTYELLSQWLASEPTQQELDGVDITDQRLMDALHISSFDYITTSSVVIHLVTNDYHMERSKAIFENFSNCLSSISNIICHEAPIEEYVECTEEDMLEIAECHVKDSQILKNLKLNPVLINTTTTF